MRSWPLETTGEFLQGHQQCLKPLIKTILPNNIISVIVKIMKWLGCDKRSSKLRGLMPSKGLNMKGQIVAGALAVFMAFNLFCYLLPEATQQRIYEVENFLWGLFIVGFFLLAIGAVVLYVILWAFLGLFE